MDRVAVFVDNGYMKKIQDRLRIRINYLTFSSAIAGGEENRFRTYVYDCPPYQSSPPTKDESERKGAFDSFRYNITRLSRFEFRTGRLQIVRDESGRIMRKPGGYPELRQKGIDMALGIDMTSLSAGNKIHKAVLVAGDSDFLPAVLFAKQAGVLVSLYYDPGTYVHDSLYEACDDRLELTKELLKKFRREPAPKTLKTKKPF
ncbi:MAG: NYN domain-containing protein [Candidatus Diapherotrites archaeon]|nr:NYN domain-containing protein [Candidatus Micrarchaeota archaeon]